MRKIEIKPKQTAKGYFEMYEIYGQQSSKFIAQKIEERGLVILN